jgi:hypothetical protein
MVFKKKEMIVKEGYIYEGQVVDTRGGWTWMDVMYTKDESGKITFYEKCYGYRADEDLDDEEYGNIVYDEDDIKDYMNSYNLSNEED